MNALTRAVLNEAHENVPPLVKKTPTVRTTSATIEVTIALPLKAGKYLRSSVTIEAQKPSNASDGCI